MRLNPMSCHMMGGWPDTEKILNQGNIRHFRKGDLTKLFNQIVNFLTPAFSVLCQEKSSFKA